MCPVEGSFGDCRGSSKRGPFIEKRDRAAFLRVVQCPSRDKETGARSSRTSHQTCWGIYSGRQQWRDPELAGKIKFGWVRIRGIEIKRTHKQCYKTSTESPGNLFSFVHHYHSLLAFWLPKDCYLKKTQRGTEQEVKEVGVGPSQIWPSQIIYVALYCMKFSFSDFKAYFKFAGLPLTGSAKRRTKPQTHLYGIRKNFTYSFKTCGNYGHKKTSQEGENRAVVRFKFRHVVIKFCILYWPLIALCIIADIWISSAIRQLQKSNRRLADSTCPQKIYRWKSGPRLWGVSSPSEISPWGKRPLTKEGICSTSLCKDCPHSVILLQVWILWELQRASSYKNF